MIFKSHFHFYILRKIKVTIKSCKIEKSSKKLQNKIYGNSLKH